MSKIIKMLIFQSIVVVNDWSFNSISVRLNSTQFDHPSQRMSIIRIINTHLRPIFWCFAFFLSAHVCCVLLCLSHSFGCDVNLNVLISAVPINWNIRTIIIAIWWHKVTQAQATSEPKRDAARISVWLQSKAHRFMDATFNLINTFCVSHKRPNRWKTAFIWNSASIPLYH